MKSVCWTRFWPNPSKWSTHQKTLDERPLIVPVEGIISPATIIRIPGEGMPRTESGGRGDLYVKFNISFPSFISQEDKDVLEQIL